MNQVDFEARLRQAAVKLASHLGGLRLRVEVLAAIPPELKGGDKNTRRASEFALNVAEEFAIAGKSGRAIAALLTALALDPGRLARAERAEILSARDPLRHSRRGIVSCLRGVDGALLDQIHPALRERLDTYDAVERLAATMRPRHRKYLEQLRHRPPGLVKSLLAAADLAFLARRLNGSDVAAMDEIFLRVPLLQPNSPEEWASVASLCIADIYRSGNLDEGECNAEVAQFASHPTFLDVVTFGVINLRLREAVQHVTLFGYELIETETQKGAVFVLQATDTAFEKSYRSAAIRERLMGAARNPMFHGEHEQKLVSMMVVAEHFLESRKWYTVQEKPFHRFVLAVPDPTHGAMDALLRGGYYEDVVLWMEQADWAVRPDALLACMVGDTLSFAEFVQAMRPLRLFLEIHTAMLAREAVNGALGLWNSCIPVLTDAELLKFIRPGNLLPEQEEELLSTLRWNGEGFLDVQYTPIIRAHDSNLIAPRVFLASRLMRNIMSLKGIRVQGAGDAFSEEVAKHLRQAGLLVAVSRPLKTRSARGEVDIAVVAGDSLVLFECKHSLVGASPHEDADAWNDAVHAAQQLKKCVKMVEEIGIAETVQRWFPHPRPAVRQIKTVVLTSTRIFSGLSLEGTVIRDWPGLQNVLHRGIVEVAESGEDLLMRGRRWSFWDEEQFSPSDLLEYLTPASRLVQTQEAFLSEYSDIQIPRERRLPMLVHRTYVANIRQDVQFHSETYQQLGLRDMGPIEFKINELATLADFQAVGEHDEQQPTDAGDDTISGTLEPGI